jgi:hypothetical protein
LQIRLPLQVFVERHAVDPIARKLRDVRRRMAIRGRPRRPAPDARIRVMEMLLQSFEQRVAVQPLAALRAPLVERAGPLRLLPQVRRMEVGEQMLEDLALDGGHSGVVHQVGRPQDLQPPLELG